MPHLGSDYHIFISATLKRHKNNKPTTYFATSVYSRLL